MGGFFLRRIFLGGILLEGILCLQCESQLSYLNMEGFDLFVKILVFVRILSQARKEGRKKFISLEVQTKAHRT